MAELVPYNTGGTLYFPLIGSGTAAWTTAASGSLSGTNILVSKDGGAFASSTNTGTVVGSGLYKWVYTTSEMSAAQITVLIGAGTLGTVVEHQGFQFRTYGSASAFYLGDWPATLMANHTVGTVSALLTGTVSTVTSPIGTVSTVLVSQSATVVGTPAVNVTQIAGTAATHTLVVDVTKASGTNVTAANGTVQVNATTGTVVASTLTDIGAISTLTSGTFDANLIQVLGTAVTGTQGFASVNVARWSGTAVPGAGGTPTVNLVADQSAVTVGTVQVSQSATVVGTPAVNLTQILGTAAEGTQGGIGVRRWAGTNVAGTDGTPVVNVVAINDTAVAHTLSVNVTQVAGTAATHTLVTDVGKWAGTNVSGTDGTPVVNMVAINDTAVAHTLAVNVMQASGTNITAANGTMSVSVDLLTGTRASLTDVPNGTAGPLQQLDWMYNMSHSQIDQVTGTQLVYNANNTLIGSAITSDDGGSYRRGSFVDNP